MSDREGGEGYDACRGRGDDVFRGRRDSAYIVRGQGVFRRRGCVNVDDLFLTQVKKRI